MCRVKCYTSQLLAHFREISVVVMFNASSRNHLMRMRTHRLFVIAKNERNGFIMHNCVSQCLSE